MYIHVYMYTKSLIVIKYTMYVYMYMHQFLNEQPNDFKGSVLTGIAFRSSRTVRTVPANVSRISLVLHEGRSTGRTGSSRIARSACVVVARGAFLS